jgi:hypothetical protein
LPIFGVEIRYGSFLTAVINFVIMAFVIFLLMKVVNQIAGFRKTKKGSRGKDKNLSLLLYRDTSESSEMSQLHNKSDKAVSVNKKGFGLINQCGRLFVFGVLCYYR